MFQVSWNYGDNLNFFFGGGLKIELNRKVSYCIEMDFFDLN